MEMRYRNKAHRQSKIDGQWMDHSEGSIWWIVDGYSMDSIDQGNLVDRWWIIDHWWIVSPGLGDGVDYEFEEADKGSLGFVGANKVKELKRDVRKAWEAKGQGHFGLTPTARQTGVLWAYGVQGKLVDKDKGQPLHRRPAVRCLHGGGHF